MNKYKRTEKPPNDKKLQNEKKEKKERKKIKLNENYKKGKLSEVGEALDGFGHQGDVPAASL